ncbi:hypothetical protein FRB95_005568 [Tulasnella sp. JGI-2019a]|nr:hypothetical protein FRB95_005568 [Tulasnella sp. JGI-2019a]
MDNPKQGLQLLSNVLKAAPIPEPFKSAVTAIPDIALQILEIVDGVKGNVVGAEALAVHIANVTIPEQAARRTRKKPRHEEAARVICTVRWDYLSDIRISFSIRDFTRALEQIKGEMEVLRSRGLSNRAFSYEDDASKLKAMKEKVDDAMKDLQLETVVAAGHGIDVIRQDLVLLSEEQRLMNQKQEMLAQQQTRQQLLTSWQQYMSSPEPRDAGFGNDILINMLGTVNSGASKKPPCLMGTRKHVLGRIT